jgi:type IV pilus assembly protein PilM
MAFGLKQLFKTLTPTNVVLPGHVVGIDIGASSVKVVELEQRDTVLALKTYGELQLGPYAGKPLGSVVQLTLQQRTEALVDVMREAGVSGEAGVLALPLSSSFVTVFGVPATAEEDLGPRVKVEARKYVPVPLAEVSLDWTELPPLRATDEPGVREVMVAAVQNESYADMNTLMASVKLASQPTEVEIFSVLRALMKPEDTSFAVIDLGAQTSKLYIAHEGMVRKIHRVFAGGAQVSDRIAQALSVSLEDAENVKRNYVSGDAHAATITQAVQGTYERALQEFRRVLLQYEARLGAPVGRVVLTGGVASFPDMASIVGYHLDRPVVRANAFTKVAYPAFMEDTLLEIAPTFTAALGAALRPYAS